MSVFITENKEELIVTCGCGCQDSIHIQIDHEYDEYYAFMSYLNGNFYRDQNAGALRSIGKKLKKIWKILTNKDY